MSLRFTRRRNRGMRRQRYALTRMFIGEDEIRCRLAAGFLLLVGILSLLLSLDRPDRETKLARAVETVTAGIDRAGIATHSLVEMEKRRQAMERDNTTTGSAAG